MKKMLLLLMCIALLLFTSCDDLIPSEEEEDSSLTTEEVGNIATATIMAGYTSVEMYDGYETDGATATQNSFSGLVITEGSSLVTFTFTNVGVDFDQNNSPDIYLDGSFVVSSGTITYTNYKVTNAENTLENMTVNGSMVMTGSNPTLMTSTLAIVSPLISDGVDVAAVMSMPDSGDPTFTSATVDGEDHTTDFNNTLTELFAQ